MRKRKQEVILKEVPSADYLQVRPQTLKFWRWAGVGPKFIRLSHRAIRYKLSELERFVRDREVTPAPKHRQQEGAAAIARNVEMMR